MKTNHLKITTLLIAAFLFIGSGTLNAQRGNMRGNGMGQRSGFQCNIPDLTEAQEKKIDDLRTSHQKNMLRYRNEMQEKRAKHNTLTTADKPDMNAINTNIDEMGAIKTKMMKERAGHRQQVRALLTDKQKLSFDSRGGRGFGYGRHGKGMMSNRRASCRGYNNKFND